MECHIDVSWPLGSGHVELQARKDERASSISRVIKVVRNQGQGCQGSQAAPRQKGFVGKCIVDALPRPALLSTTFSLTRVNLIYLSVSSSAVRYIRDLFPPVDSLLDRVNNHGYTAPGIVFAALSGLHGCLVMLC